MNDRRPLLVAWYNFAGALGTYLSPSATLAHCTDCSNWDHRYLPTFVYSIPGIYWKTAQTCINGPGLRLATRVWLALLPKVLTTLGMQSFVTGITN